MLLHDSGLGGKGAGHMELIYDFNSGPIDG